MTGVVEELRRHGRKVLHEARMTVRAPLDEVVEELREGSSREELVAACAEHGPAIAVVGSRGVGGFRGLLLEHAPCSVLLVRDVPRLSGPRSVVAAVDGSETSSSVVAMARAAAAALSGNWYSRMSPTSTCPSAPPM